MGKLDGKVALISGGARGQGAAEAETFAREGAKVVFGDILDAEGKNVEASIRTAGGEATYVHLDVKNEADWQNAVKLATGRHARPGGPETTASTGSAGADGHGGRDRDGGALSSVRRLVVHDRKRAGHRRWSAGAMIKVVVRMRAAPRARSSPGRTGPRPDRPCWLRSPASARRGSHTPLHCLRPRPDPCLERSVATCRLRVT